MKGRYSGRGQVVNYIHERERERERERVSEREYVNEQ